MFSQLPGAVDRETYQQLKSHKLTTDANPNVFAWFYLVAKFAETTQATWGGAAATGGKQEKKAAPAKTEEKPKAAAAKEEDDDMDLFGDEEETEVSEYHIYILNNGLLTFCHYVIGGQGQAC